MPTHSTKNSSQGALEASGNSASPARETVQTGEGRMRHSTDWTGERSALGTANGLRPPPPTANFTQSAFTGLQAARKKLRDRDFHPLNLRATTRRYVGPAIQGRGYGLGWCGLFAAEGADLVTITPDGFKGVKRCGSPYCPVCGCHASYDAKQWALMAIKAAHAQGYHVAMVTTTQSHSADQCATDALQLHIDGRTVFWRRVNKDWLGRIGSLDALEVTLGRNGWHWHTHSLLFTKEKLTVEKILRLKAAWVQAVADSGGVACDEFGLTVELCRQGKEGDPDEVLALYAAKADGLAWEVVGQSSKRAKKNNLSVIDLLAMADKSNDARLLAIEALQAVVGKRRRFSTGRLAAKLGIPPLSEGAPEIDTPPSEVVPEVAEAYPTIEFADLRLLAALFKRAEVCLIRVALRHGQRGVDRVVRYGRARSGNVVPLPCLPPIEVAVPRHEKPLGAWTYDDLEDAANDASDVHHAFAVQLLQSHPRRAA